MHTHNAYTPPETNTHIHFSLVLPSFLVHAHTLIQTEALSSVCNCKVLADLSQVLVTPPLTPGPQVA